MKKRQVGAIAFVPLFAGVAAAQSFREDLEAVRKIRLLEADSNDVAKILPKDNLTFYKEEPLSSLSLTASYVRIEYSSGKCSSESESPFMGPDDWDVAKSKVTKIVISPWDNIELKGLGIDLTKFRRERLYRSHKNLRILHDKEAGIAVEIHGGRVERVYLFPSRENVALLCKNKSLRKFYLGNKWRRYPEEKHSIVDFDYPAHVTDLRITKLEDEEKRFRVQVTAIDPENDVLTYNYGISAGRIIGAGANVTWDLSSAPSGTYKITAGVDDGCGICGRIMTKTVTIE